MAHTLIPPRTMLSARIIRTLGVVRGFLQKASLPAGREMGSLPQESQRQKSRLQIVCGATAERVLLDSLGF